jgi:hypothetical protein
MTGGLDGIDTVHRTEQVMESRQSCFTLRRGVDIIPESRESSKEIRIQFKRVFQHIPIHYVCQLIIVPRMERKLVSKDKTNNRSSVVPFSVIDQSVYRGN